LILGFRDFGIFRFALISLKEITKVLKKNQDRWLWLMPDVMMADF